MIDPEVIRLRRLRNTVLRARAIANALDVYCERPHTAFSRSALDCWRVARVLTGKLRAHPYQPYQRGPGDLRTIYNHLSAMALGRVSVRAGRPWRTLGVELQRVARELDDVRALTWSPQLSDTLGRSQAAIRALAAEVDAAARKEGGISPLSTRQDSSAVSSDADDSQRTGQWPYLAI